MLGHEETGEVTLEVTYNTTSHTSLAVAYSTVAFMTSLTN